MNSLPSLTIASLLKRPTRPVFILGAGCSAKSGIPTSEALVGQIGKWGYCVANARDVGDPTVVRTDWWPWLTKQPWFRHDRPLADQYPTAVEAILRPREDRKAFFHRILNPDVPPSRGYQVLAQLLARHVILTTLTTNFDQILAAECRSTAAVYHVDEIRTPDDFKLISTTPEYPQVIYLHGSVDHYTDQNIEQETQRLNPALVENLYPLLRDHPVVVIGYRGAEPSVMRHLLEEQAERCAGFRRGIYWCHRESEPPTAESPLLAQLAGSLGNNFQFVKIDGFDELMAELSGQLPELLASTALGSAPSGPSASHPIVHDLEPSPVAQSDLDRPLLKAKIVAYCEAVRLPTPNMTSDDAMTSAMAERNLAVRSYGQWHPSKGGRLLFARSPDVQMAAARIDVEIDGDPAWVAGIVEHEAQKGSQKIEITGNLWVQLETLLSLLARLNRPFRLKGNASREIYPYPPLALKEIATNLLAHRDYREAIHSRVRITPEKIIFENPGGLTEHVRQRLQNRDIETVIRDLARGIKGYRNPVIADFFFSAGAMDKEGSGLPDVIAEASNNLNSVKFGPVDDNKAFRVEITVRPEALTIDPTTRTARATQREVRYSPNLLPISGWPRQVWTIPITASRGDSKTLREAGAPPFCRIGDNELWTFSDPRSEQSAPFLHVASDGEIRARPTEDLLSSKFAHTALPWLLNHAIEQHLDRLGIHHRFVGGSIRAYYPSESGAPRAVNYRGLFKQAKRTVTKPVISKTTGKVFYWEHKAVSLRFERFSDTWALSLLPTYVFTNDGADDWIASHLIGPKTTRRTARDYNSTVLHNLVFWSRVLAQTTESTFPLQLNGTALGIDSNPEVALEVASLIPVATFEEQADTSRSVAVDEPFDGVADDDQDADVITDDDGEEGSTDAP